MTPLALVARPGVVLIPHAAYEQVVSYLQTTRTILALYVRKMTPSGLFGGGEGNIHA